MVQYKCKTFFHFRFSYKPSNAWFLFFLTLGIIHYGGSHMTKNSIYFKQWLEEDYHIKIITYFYKSYSKSNIPKDHKHDVIEILQLVNGSAQIEFKDHILTIKKGDVIFIDANVEHKMHLKEDKNCRALNIEFVFEKAKNPSPSFRTLVDNVPVLKTFLENETPYIISSDPKGYLSSLLKRLIEDLDHADQSNAFMEQILLSNILVEFAKLQNEFNRMIESPQDDYVNRIVSYLKHNYDKKIKANDIAKELNLTERYIEKIFKNKKKTTINKYLTDLRIRKAQNLLRYSDIELIDICGYIGIENQQYFSTLFKKHTGMTPMEYRKSYYI